MFDLKKHKIEIKHIYSHIPEKLRLAQAEGPKKLVLVAEKIARNRQQLGEYAEVAERLNVGADLIAGDKETNTVEFYEPFITRDSQPYLLVNHKGDVTGDIYKFLKKDLNLKRRQKWIALHQENANYELLRPPQYYTYKHLKKRMNSHRFYHSDETNFIHKMLLKILPTRSKMYHRIKNWKHQNSWPRNLKKRKERLCKIYGNTDCCAFCDNNETYVTEVQHHIFSSCPSSIAQNIQLALQIEELKLGYNYGNQNVYWFNTSRVVYTPQLLLGDYGFLPVQLKEEFPNFPPHVWPMFKEDLEELVIKNVHNKWKNRCKYLYDSVHRDEDLYQDFF